MSVSASPLLYGRSLVLRLVMAAILTLSLAQLSAQLSDNLGNIYLAKKLIDEKEYATAQTLLESSLPVIPPGDAYHQAYARMWLGECLFYEQRYQEALTVTKQAEAIVYRSMDVDTFTHTLFLLNNLGAIHGMLQQEEQQTKYYRLAFERTRKEYKSGSAEWAEGYFNISNSYYRRFMTDSCLIYLDSAHVIAVSTRDYFLESHILRNKSAALARTGDYAEAIRTQVKALEYNEEPFDIIVGHLNLADYYFCIGNYAETKQYLDLSQQHLARQQRDGSHFELEMALYTQGCQLYEALGNTTQFADYARRLLKVANASQNPYLIKVALNYQVRYQLMSANYTEAMRLAQQALRTSPGSYPETDGTTHKLLAEMYYLSGQYALASSHIQQALSNICTDFGPTAPSQLPKVSNISIVDKTLEILALRINIYTLWWKQTGNEAYARTAEDTYMLAEDLFDQRRSKIYHSVSRQVLGSQIRELTQATLGLYYEKYERSRSVSWIEKAWLLMENSRSLLLLEKLHFRDAIQVLPNDRRYEIERLSYQIADVQSYLAKIPPSDADYQRLKRKLADLEGQWTQAMANLSVTNPSFFNWIHQRPNTDLAAVMQLMGNDNEQLVSYFDGDRQLFAVAIDGGQANFFRVDLPASSTEMIQALRLSINNRSRTAYQQLYELYDLLLKPVLRDNKGSRLAIIPDGPFWLLPFEILLTAPVGSGRNSSLPYLLRTYTVRLMFSYQTALVQQREKAGRTYAHTILSMAPATTNFKTARADVPFVTALPGSVTTQRKLSTTLGDRGIFLSGPAATDKAFRRWSGDARIIHIDTHAFLNDQTPDYTWLFFQPSDKKDPGSGIVSASEIQQLSLRAELAVLGFCDSGNGKLHAGEGLASLAREFYIAGCSNVLVSSWALPDQPATYIMQRFYDYLFSGMGKAAALQQAKLDYLDDEAHRFALHPYFWAGLQMIGDDEPMDLLGGQSMFSNKSPGTTKIPVYFLAALIAGIAGLGWLIRVKSIRSW
jgi:CHAT domain-containing protein